MLPHVVSIKGDRSDWEDSTSIGEIKIYNFIKLKHMIDIQSV